MLGGSVYLPQVMLAEKDVGARWNAAQNRADSQVSNHA
jgi:hypothetical protein